ncbi:MAG: hypothetical protein WD768_10720 [Phycisphaeraceae bacterium]
MLFKSAIDKVDDFCRTRVPQADADFLRELDAQANAERSHIGLAVRRAVAKAGQVDPRYIRADDRESVELAILPLWDSMDWVRLVMNIEDELGISIPTHEAMTIRVRDFSVRSCVEDVSAIVRRLRDKSTT